MNSRSAFFLLPIIFLTACKSEKEPSSEITSEKKIYDHWLIDFDMIEEGCERIDCIRSIDDPKFIDVDDVDFLKEDDLVIGLRIGDDIRCYPHALLDWHEIINDQFKKTAVAVNYCPLTGSGMAWNRTIDGKITTFGISGLLYNSNVIPYDRNSRSAWCQMKQLCVNGELENARPETYQVVETSWRTWKKLYPDSRVVSLQTGMTRDYGSYPYYEYKENRDIYFEVEHESDTLHPKERLYGFIVNGNASCYRFDNFKSGLRMIHDDVFGKKVVVIGSEPDNFIVAFEQPGNTEFSLVKGRLPGIFKDTEDNMYDLFGVCVEGKKKGERLGAMNGFVAYWFAWYAFYPDLTFQ